MVFVVDTNKQPLAPCHPARARALLAEGKAAVFRRFPFTIILKQAVSDLQPSPMRIKLDPGSRTTGLAVVNDNTGQVVFAAEITHRAMLVHSALDDRRAVRRGRRNRHTRYRPARFLNRHPVPCVICGANARHGHPTCAQHTRMRPLVPTAPRRLPPSVQSRVYNIATWVNRLQRLTTIAAISQELVRFDMQLMENPDIAGVGYQQGTLAGYEVREYLLEKFNRTCAYCGAKNVPLQIEHIVPKSRGGSNRISNLAIACVRCNLAKGTKTAEEFGHPKIQAQAKKPLKDAAAVNTSRWTLYAILRATGLPVETGSGGLTKFNRTQRHLPKTHWLDAACVGQSTPTPISHTGIRPVGIKAMGHGNRKMCQTDAYGFPRAHRQRKATYTYRAKDGTVQVFRTGDMVRAIVPAKLKTGGTYIGRIGIRATPSFNLFVGGVRIGSVHPQYMTIIQHADGYTYELLPAINSLATINPEDVAQQQSAYQDAA